MTLERDGLDWKLSIENEPLKPSEIIKKYDSIIKEAIEEINPVSIYITAVLIVNEKPFNFISPPVDTVEEILNGFVSLEANILLSILFVITRFI